MTTGYGLQREYDGSGYLLNLDYGITRDEYIEQIDSIFNESDYFEESKLTVLIGGIAFYIPSHDWIISINILIEFDQTGKIYATKLDILPLQLESD